MLTITLLLALLAQPDPVPGYMAAIRRSASEFDFSKARDIEAFKRADVAASMAKGQLLALLLKDPSAWERARPLLQDLPQDKKRRDVKIRLLEILSRDAHKTTQALLDKEVSKNMRGISARVLIRMDQNGSQVAPKKLNELVAQEPSFRNLEAAIHLGLKKDKAAIPVLKWALESGAGTRHFIGHSYGTAIAWQRLGDDKPWKALEKRARAEVDKSLEANDIKTAAWYALQLAFYRDLNDVDVLAVDGDCGRYVVKRRETIKTAADVRRYLP